MHAFATCPKGLESLLLTELRSLGVESPRETVAGVSFEASLRILYEACLWSRLANRILLRIAELPTPDVEALYVGARELPWTEHLSNLDTFAVTFSGSLAGVSDPRFAALRVKDAVVDAFRDRGGERPSVDRVDPAVRINVRAGRERSAVAIDLGGESLHRRGYRAAAGAAPLKENLAAAVLLRAGWPEIAQAGGALIDPMCGAATLLVEGAEIAADLAPGRRRTRWGFEGWGGHDSALWREVREAAEARHAAGLARARPEILGYDADERAVHGAERNVAAAGLAERISVRVKPLSRLVRPTHRRLEGGLVVCNPPYGERLGDEAALVHLYRHLGARLREEFDGWRAAVLTGNPGLGRGMGLRAGRRYRLWNGPIASQLLLFEVGEASHVGPASRVRAGPPAPPRLSPGAEMLANRLRKNARGLRRWREQAGITAYRLYDADIPEYAVAIDVYGERAHLAEYAPPSTIDPGLARTRLREAVAATAAVLEMPAERIAVKERSRQRGREQYRRRAGVGELIEVREGRARLLVNLDDYLDTGLFLDHRRLRLRLGEIARGRRFLNLFCYTASATVHAVLGGARASTSVDLSATYLAWAEKNLAANGIGGRSHRLIRADSREWLIACRERFDVVLLDPPTFSNSKRMSGSFDVQRDHRALVEAALGCLDDGGLLVFSTNRRRFELDPTLAEACSLEDVTGWSRDRDFSRGRAPHRCWFIRRRA